MTDKREKMTTMPEMAAQCATPDCKQTHHPHRFPVGSGPFCGECQMVSLWSADAATKRQLGIYPSRETGNHTVEGIDAIQAGNRKKANQRRAREIANEANSGDASIGAEVTRLMGDFSAGGQVAAKLLSPEQLARVVDSALDLDASSAESRSFDAADA